MGGNIITVVALSLAAVLYVALKRWLEQRALKRLEKNDEFLLSTLAMTRQTNTLDIFLNAGSVWNFSTSKVRDDFKRYLKTGDIPRYVCLYIRDNVTSSDLKYRKMFHPAGGGLPRSWAA